MAAVGLYSVVPAVLWPVPRGERTWAESAGCEGGLRFLRDDLLNRAAMLVTTGRPAYDTKQAAWLRTWDDRFLALRAICEEKGAPAHELLGRLRYRMEPQLSRFERELGDLHEQLTHSLDDLADGRDARTSP